MWRTIGQVAKCKWNAATLALSTPFAPAAPPCRLSVTTQLATLLHPHGRTQTAHPEDCFLPRPAAKATSSAPTGETMTTSLCFPPPSLWPSGVRWLLNAASDLRSSGFHLRRNFSN